MPPLNLFRPAPPRSALSNVVWTAVQSAVIWTIALVVVPLAIVGVERRFGWHSAPWPHARPAAALLFVGFSALNLIVGFALAVRGEGTPLPTAAPRMLVITGPYRFVRNPMAIAGIGQGIAVALSFGSWVVLGYALAGAVVWHYGVRPPEERDLAARFGEAYVRYRGMVPLWWPRFSAIAWCAVLCLAGALACRSPRAPETFDRCDRNPPDSVPPPPIDVRASSDAPGVVWIDARTNGPSSSVHAILDQLRFVIDSGRIRFNGVPPGAHRLRLLSFGYGERDTIITMPADSALHLRATLTRGGGIGGCSSYIIEKE